MAPVTGVANFRQFDVVDADPSDHFYFKTLSNCTTRATDQSIFTTEEMNQSIFTTKAKFDAIMRERKQLEQYMPDSIFIRAYKHEISLLRAAIVGLPGTPYHNFLFFFDICLPTYYPSIPPMIRYQGFDVVGLISPILGFGGEIFFNRIKDVSGKPSKRWNPKSSTLLQRLLAIQTLVFDEKPYYNKYFNIPFARKDTRERWAAEYNDEMLQLCCVLTTNILKLPPRNFEALVATHFRQRGLEIVRTLVACRERITHKNSFKEYSKLVLALSKNGAHLDDYVEQVGAEKVARELAEKEKKTKLIDKFSGLLSNNSIQIGSKRYVRLQNDKVDL